MANFIVRAIRATEESARRDIVTSATRELRRIYRPRESADQCAGTPSGVLVAVEGGTLVGTAEYVRKTACLYIQGVAVHPDYRGRGICRALVDAAEAIAYEAQLTTLALCAIEETGNVEVFGKLGFRVTSRAVAPNHVSPGGGPVTQVDMERAIQTTGPESN